MGCAATKTALSATRKNMNKKNDYLVEYVQTVYGPPSSFGSYKSVANLSRGFVATDVVDAQKQAGDFFQKEGEAYTDGMFDVFYQVTGIKKL